MAFGKRMKKIFAMTSYFLSLVSGLELTMPCWEFQGIVPSACIAQRHYHSYTTHTHIHTYIHTYIHTPPHTHTHTHIHTPRAPQHPSRTHDHNRPHVRITQAMRVGRLPRGHGFRDSTDLAQQGDIAPVCLMQRTARRPVGCRLPPNPPPPGGLRFARSLPRPPTSAQPPRDHTRDHTNEE